MSADVTLGDSTISQNLTHPLCNYPKELSFQSYKEKTYNYNCNINILNVWASSQRPYFEQVCINLGHSVSSAEMLNMEALEL